MPAKTLRVRRGRLGRPGICRPPPKPAPIEAPPPPPELENWVELHDADPPGNRVDSAWMVIDGPYYTLYDYNGNYWTVNLTRTGTVKTVHWTDYSTGNADYTDFPFWVYIANFWGSPRWLKITLTAP